jgi:hypothetical protein
MSFWFGCVPCNELLFLFLNEIGGFAPLSKKDIPHYHFSAPYLPPYKNLPTDDVFPKEMRSESQQFEN